MTTSFGLLVGKSSAHLYGDQILFRQLFLDLTVDLAKWNFGFCLLQVDGEWSTWGDWQSCSVTCGPGGTRRRSRTCQAAANLGLQVCPDAGAVQDEEDGQPCEEDPCRELPNSLSALTCDFLSTCVFIRSGAGPSLRVADRHGRDGGHRPTAEHRHHLQGGMCSGTDKDRRCLHQMDMMDPFLLAKVCETKEGI